MKKILKIIGVIVLLLIVALLLCPLWLGPVAGMVANSVVPGITGTEFKVEKIGINPYSGTLRVEKLRLANPKGYGAEDAVAFDLFSVKIAPMSLLKDVITINDVTLESPYVSYLDANGTNNFDQIIANASAGKKEAEEAPKEEKPAKEGEGKKVVVERLSISGTRVRYGLVTLPIPNIVLTGLGASEGGVTIESIGLEIWEKIKSSFMSAGGAIGGAIGGAAKMLGDGGSSLLNSVTSGDAAKGVTDGAKDAASSVGSAAGKVVDGVGDGAKKAADTVSEGAKKATEAIGNLFK